MLKTAIFFRLTSLLLVIALFAAALGLSQPAGATPDPGLKWEEKVDPWVMETAAKGPTEFLVFLAAQADLSAAAALPTKLEKGTYVYQTLSELAERTQAPVLAQLKQLGVEHRSYWVANMVWVRGGMGAVQAMAQRGDVAHVYANPRVRLDEPADEETLAPEATDAVIWNIELVNADDVWAAGYRGQGVVVGGQDTGYMWDHPALINAYRGWDGDSADHNYNWHDAIHSGTSSCGVNLSVPCDDHYMGHGTHTMGTMVGDDGGENQIGMAPGARWIGCRNMAEGFGTLAAYTECYQWFIAPTDLNNLNPRSDLAPDVINNSWKCTYSEGCTYPNALLTVVESVRAAGILTVHSAGNEGPECETVNAPAAIYDASYSVGNTTEGGYIYTYSSIGPVTVDGSGRMKPDISAPGTDIYSSVPPDVNPDGYAILTGTSMAAPHVAGLAALLISADPELAGHPDSLESYINRTAVPDLKIPVIMPTICGGVPYTTFPNNHFGWGRIDALAAFLATDPLLITIAKTASSGEVTMGEVFTYTLTAANTHDEDSATNVIVTDTLPPGTYFASTDAPYTLNNGTITWNLGTLAPGKERSLTLNVLVGINAGDTVTNAAYSIHSDQAGPVYGKPVSTAVVAIPLYYTFLPLTSK